MGARAATAADGWAALFSPASSPRFAGSIGAVLQPAGRHPAVLHFPAGINGRFEKPVSGGGVYAALKAGAGATENVGLCVNAGERRLGEERAFLFMRAAS